MKKQRPVEYKRDFIAAVVRRSGICRATVEQVLPAVFDEVRYQLAEGALCVAIESFGTFAIKDVPLRQHLYTYKGKSELRTLQPKKVIKFAPTKNLRQEVEGGRFDSSHRSFTHHPGDPPLRKRNALRYQPNRNGMHRGPTIYPEAHEDELK